MTGASVREASADDVAAVAALELEAFPEDAWSADYLRAAVAGELPTVRLLVAEVAGTVVGHALVSVVFEVAELQRIAVTGTRRRQGIARRILDEVTGLAAAAGAERLLLEVREQNQPALAFYRKAGFAEIDRRERYYRDGSTAIVLQLGLD